jgi:transcriptional regulator with XRE-family HTH domain
MAAARDDLRTAGELIRFWRGRRRLSQLELALEANLSTKHLCFVETGRSQPSRQLLIHIVERLQIPMRDRNQLLLAAGFAPIYPELPYDGDDLEPLRDALSDLLAAHEPNPAVIVDGYWNLLEHNKPAELLWDGVDEALLEPPINLLRLACHPRGLPAISSMTPRCNRGLLLSLRRRSHDDADAALLGLLDEIDGYLPDDDGSRPPAGPAALAAFELYTRAGPVRLFTVIATLGAPLEVTTAGLAIETFLPADSESAARLRQLNEPAAAATAADTSPLGLG